jgi:hypothetical protein
MTTAELVLPPTRSFGTALSSGLAALIVVVFAVALFVDPMVEDHLRPGILAFGLLFGGTLAILAVALGRGHGALWLDGANRRLGLGVTALGDTWWIPLERVAGLRMVAVPSPGTTIERWMLLIVLKEKNVTIELAESDARATLDGIGSRLATHLGLDYDEGRDDLDLASARPAEARFAVNRRAALSLVLASFGVSLIAVGVLAASQLEKEPIVGFIFAPILVVMGIALGMVALVKRLASETLSSDGVHFTHAFTLGRWRWGVRKIRATTPRFRLRLLGMRGAMLEIVGEDGTLVVAAGATSRSRLSLEAIARLPATFIDSAS